MAKPMHVILVIEENQSFSTVYPYGMPWLSSLGDANGIAVNYFSDEPGSLEDYLWLSSGSGEHAFGCTGGGCSQPITDDNIFREINNAGLSWKVYADSLPYAGFMGSYSGNYVRRHNPASWYSDIIHSSTEQKKMVPFSDFAADVANGTLPDYSIIVPDVQHDAHNASIGKADAWLKQNLGPVLASSYFKPGGTGVLFVTFDNGDGDAQGQVLTVVAGPSVTSGVKVKSSYRHENALRTIMELLRLKNFPGASADAKPMDEFFH
jgi:acid phosphatase